MVGVVGFGGIGFGEALEGLGCAGTGRLQSCIGWKYFISITCSPWTRSVCRKFAEHRFFKRRRTTLGEVRADGAERRYWQFFSLFIFLKLEEQRVDSGRTMYVLMSRMFS